MNEHDNSTSESGSGGVLGAAGRMASTWVGAVLSLALMAGVAVWFYRLGTRDASDIPVIRAAAGPAKERPEDPGGDTAPHQTIASYSAVEGGAVPGTAPEPRPQLALDPAAPEPGDGPMQTEPPRARPGVPELPPPDTTVAALDPAPGDSLTDAGGAPAGTDAGGAPAGTDAVPQTPAVPVAEVPPEVPEALPVPVPVPVPVPDPDPAAAVEPALVPEPETAAEPEPETVTALAPAVSPRARPRPPGLAERAAIAAALATAEAEAALATAADIVPATATAPNIVPAPAPVAAPDTLARAAAASRVQVQLGAYETPEITRRMWQSVLGTHGDLLAGRALSVQSTISGGKTWYRLRVGPFRDTAEARNICAALQARGQDCIVARNG